MSQLITSKFALTGLCLPWLLLTGCASGLWQSAQPWPQNQGPVPFSSAVGAGVNPQAVQQPTGLRRGPVTQTLGNQPQGNQSPGNQPAFGQPTFGQPAAGQPFGNGSQTRNTDPFQATQPTTTSTAFYRSQSPQDGGGSGTTFAPTDGGIAPAFQSPTFGSGLNDPNAPIQGNNFANSTQLPDNFADIDIYLSETETGRINFGGAYNSDSGIVGQFTIDERNFDITRLPRSFRDIVDGTAFRGGGQNFRLELVPGSDVERYLVSFSEPFLFNTPISFSTSLFLFDRQFFDYDEQRLGGRFAFGYRLAPDISVSAGLRLENVEITDPRVATSPQLNAVLGDSDLYLANISLIRDTRDHPFLPTEGNYLSLTYSQGFGEFDFPRGDIDFRTYRLMYQRPDGSGRHTLSYGTKLGFSGAQTPVFENYFAGGFSTLRGFDFRGASPAEGGIRVGGEFQWLNTLEYTFPLTSDDMVKGVLFTDFGTVEENIEINSDNFRIAPGFGFRVHLPAAGIGAPLAFDFAFPVAEAAGDDRETFSFYLGVSR